MAVFIPFTWVAQGLGPDDSDWISCPGGGGGSRGGGGGAGVAVAAMVVVAVVVVDLVWMMNVRAFRLIIHYFCVFYLKRKCMTDQLKDK